MISGDKMVHPKWSSRSWSTRNGSI